MPLDISRPRVALGWAVIAWSLMSLAAHAAPEIHRCVDGGRVTYTDRGCLGTGEVIAIAAVVPVSANGRDGAEVAYVRATPVAVGMSPRMVYEAMGRPVQTVATLEGRALVEYWSYRGAEGTTRVAFQEGRVTRIHTR